MADRLKRHFKKYADEYVFLELMPDYVKKENMPLWLQMDEES